MIPEPLVALDLPTLRHRTSMKWRTYPEDVLPLFVAETDFPLAPAISRALTLAVSLGDTGYIPPDSGLGDAYAGFAARRLGWQVDPARVRSTGDVMMGVVEILRRVTSPGDRVVITPPVYPPFYDCIPEAGAQVQAVPLASTGVGWELDLRGIEQALAGGARAVLLCNPHNPTGTVHSREFLTQLAAIAAHHGAAVLSDEIHAPLALPGTTFTPFLSVSADAAQVGYTLTSASKAFNLAGLKCALMVTAADGPSAVVQELPIEVEWRTGLFGAHAAIAGFSEASDPWLDSLLVALQQNHQLLKTLLAVHLPLARYRIPDAGFLAWVDLRGYDWGDNPARRILREAKVAVNSGPTFGELGNGYIRINVGCSPDVLREAVQRIANLGELPPPELRKRRDLR